jgi:predicted dehydrogenase
MNSSPKEIGIGLIGYGHWGPNHARVFNQLPECRVHIIADRDDQRLAAIGQHSPGTEATSDYDAVLRHLKVDAVVIATPTKTHYSLVKSSLLAGKDVLVEKPISYTAYEARDLVELAYNHERILMCGHIFLFNTGIRKLRQYIEEGTLGQIYYMAATRTNLGPLRDDVNSLHDLGSHDVSIFHYLLDERPREVSAWGESYIQPDLEDMTFACLEYPNRILCHMHVSWLNPLKERRLVVVGDKKMAVWDDTSPLESIRLYDKGLAEEPYYDSFGQFQRVLRDGDVLIPKLKAEEPLKVQNQHFLECVRTRQRPLTDSVFALDVMLTLEALQHSLRKGGAREPVESRLYFFNKQSKANSESGLLQGAVPFRMGAQKDTPGR